MPTLAQRIKTAFGYPSLDDTNRRRKTSRRTTHELYAIPGYKRQQMSATVRDEHRAFGILAWMIRRHLDNVSRFAPHVDTGNELVNERLRYLLKWHSRPRNFDTLGRHSRDEWMRQFEACKVIAGDAAGVKTQGGRMQGIEGDRIALGTGSTVSAGYARITIDGKPYTVSEEGLVFESMTPDAPDTDPVGGRVAGYCICKRTGARGEMLTAERIVSASDIVFDGYWPERFDANRGVSPITVALNQCADCREAHEYILLKIKIGALFGWGFTRAGESEQANALGAFTPAASGAMPASPSNNELLSYQAQVQRGIDARGPIVIDLDPGDSMAEVKGETPNGEIVPFTREIIRSVMLALDMPFIMYDSIASSYSAREMDRNEYDEACEWKRDKNVAVLEQIYSPDWCVGIWADADMAGFGKALKAAKMTPDEAAAGISWYPNGRPAPTSNELDAIQRQLAMGLGDIPSLAARYGLDAYEIARRQKRFIDTCGTPIFYSAPGAVPIGTIIKAPPPAVTVPKERT